MESEASKECTEVTEDHSISVWSRSIVGHSLSMNIRIFGGQLYFDDLTATSGSDWNAAGVSELETGPDPG